MPITVEALDTTPPQVGVTVTGLDEGSASTISVQRSWDDGYSWHTVQGADRVSATGAWFVRDFAPPLNVEAVYRVVVHSGDGVVLRTNLATPPKPVNGSPGINPYTHVPAADAGGTTTVVVGSSASSPGRDVFRVRWDTASTGLTTSDLARGGTYPVTPGKWYGLGFWLVNAGGTRTFQASLQWLSGGSGLPQTQGDATNVAGAQRWVSVVAQAPGAATDVRLDLDLDTGASPLWGVGDGYDLREHMLIEADTQDEGEAAVATYFDGDSAASGTRYYEWTDTANDSASVEKTDVAESAPITITSEYGYLMDPLDPQNAVAIACRRSGDTLYLLSDSANSYTLNQPQGLATVQGARLPVASVGQRQAAAGLALHLRAAAGQGALVNDLRRLLDTSGQVVITGLPADLGLDAVMHVIAGVTDVPVVGGLLGSMRDLLLDTRQVRPQSLRIMVPFFTYGDVAALVEQVLGAGSTYQDVMDATPGSVYLDWLRDPEEVLGL